MKDVGVYLLVYYNSIWPGQGFYVFYEGHSNLWMFLNWLCFSKKSTSWSNQCGSLFLTITAYFCFRLCKLESDSHMMVYFSWARNCHSKNIGYWISGNCAAPGVITNGFLNLSSFSRLWKCHSLFPWGMRQTCKNPIVLSTFVTQNDDRNRRRGKWRNWEEMSALITSRERFFMNGLN